MRENVDRYKSIINLPHPVSKKHTRMSNYDRAAQFAPFAALTGFDEEVEETSQNHKVEELVYEKDEEAACLAENSEEM